MARWGLFCKPGGSGLTSSAFSSHSIMDVTLNLCKKNKNYTHPSGSCFRAFWGVFPLCHVSVVKPNIGYVPVSVYFKLILHSLVYHFKF